MLFDKMASFKQKNWLSHSYLIVSFTKCLHLRLSRQARKNWYCTSHFTCTSRSNCMSGIKFYGMQISLMPGSSRHPDFFGQYLFTLLWSHDRYRYHDGTMVWSWHRVDLITVDPNHNLTGFQRKKSNEIRIII